MANINLVVGQTYRILFVPNERYATGKRMDALYLGFNPIETSPFFKSNRPEGHVFARRSSQGDLQLYEARINTPKIDFDGIRVSPANDENLSISERAFLCARVDRAHLRMEETAA